VFVAGPPPLVDSVRVKSRAAAARCYADPFLPNTQPLSLVDRVMAMLRRPAAAPIEAPRPVAPAIAVPRGRIEPAAASAIPPLPASAPRRTQAGSRR
jgi:3-phenylpropionate/trans-cinnamate dioxygenase ferredoxin reductase subunit